MTPEQRREIAEHAARHGIYATVRHFGVSRGTVRTWLRRATAAGFEDKARCASYTRKARKNLTSVERHRRWTARFWLRIRRNGTCWIWTGPVTGNGTYPSLGGNPTTYVHRWAWEQKYGTIPSGRDLHHTCKHTLCVNPDHLESLTRGEHIRLEHSLLERCPKNHLMRLGRCHPCEQAQKQHTRRLRRRSRKERAANQRADAWLKSLPPAPKHPGVRRWIAPVSRRVHWLAYGYGGNRQNTHLGSFRKFEDAVAAADRFRRGTAEGQRRAELRRLEDRKKWLRALGPPPKYYGVIRRIAPVLHRVSYTAELRWSENGRQKAKYLGSFRTAEEAAHVRDRAARQLPPVVRIGPGGAYRRYNFGPQDERPPRKRKQNAPSPWKPTSDRQVQHCNPEERCRLVMEALSNGIAITARRNCVPKTTISSWLKRWHNGDHTLVWTCGRNYPRHREK